MAVRFSQTVGSSRLDESDVVIVGVPFNGTTSYPDLSTNAPEMMRQSSMHLIGSSYSIWQNKQVEDAIVCDVGQLTLSHAMSAEDSVEEITPELVKLYRTFPVVLGGDHSVSYSTVCAASERLKKKLHVVSIDAHHDLFGDNDEPLNHGNWLLHAIQDGWVERATILGARSASHDKGDPEFMLKEWKVDMIGPDWATTWSPNAVSDLPVWLTVDMDGFDPSVAPGVLTREPGGLSSSAGLKLIARILATNQVVGGDVTEYWPLLDHAGLTANLASTIVREYVIHFSNREDNPWKK